ncbi:transposase [Flavobacterium xueshanense]|uniref:Transposase n=1 Tax=Flavobacterium xueshanense TaxID=935223 RepID=A0A1I2GAW8_9FLAO|nr:transposase [Flavobacterium xueshanense]SFF14077.1 transposase [Flavobacterium xueshanense]
MKTLHKIYDTALKEKAVEHSNERSNITELARELGIRVTLLYKWRKDYEKYGIGRFPGKGILKQKPDQKTISELEAKLKDAELERDILKKAIGIFSKNGR